MTAETTTELRDDGRTFQQLRVPRIELLDRTLIYKCTDTVILATLQSSPAFQIYVSSSQSCNPTAISVSKAFVNLAVRSQEKVAVRLHITVCDRAIPSHLVNAASVALAVFGVASNGVFSASCNHDGSRVDGPESSVFLASGSGKSFVFAERIHEKCVLDALAYKCDEMRDILRAVLCD